MARQYPYYNGIHRTLKGPSNKPCVVCKNPATRYAEVQVSWFRGDDIEIALCNEKDCRQTAAKNVGQYLSNDNVQS